MPDHPTVENELDTIFDKFNGEGAHACYCQRSVDGGCQCAIKDEYATEAKESIKALIASETKKDKLTIAAERAKVKQLQTVVASLKDTHTGEE